MLDALERARYSRHLLLPEIGNAGQEKLLLARVSVATSADPLAVEVALDYLGRSGVNAAQPDDAALALPLPSSALVDAVAGRPELREASALLLGAFSAVEAIKQITGAGSASTFPSDFVLAEEM